MARGVVAAVLASAALTVWSGSAAGDPYAALETIHLSDGSSFTTHGVDPVLDAALPVLLTADRADVACVEPRDPHFEVIAAAPGRVPDAAVAQALRTSVYRASAYLAEEGRKHAPIQLALPVLCDAAGDVLVDRIALPTPATADSARTIISDLRRLGHRDKAAKYLVFYDDCVSLDEERTCFSGGQATLELDDRPGPRNRNNRGPSYAIDFGGGSDPEPSWTTLLHEAAHTMGAVQLSAPHTTGRGHCTDGQDIMCYQDHPGADYDPYVCVVGAFDCNSDDYFDPTPAPGSYLDTHWNLGRDTNHYLVDLLER